jgi:hypothetical protein
VPIREVFQKENDSWNYFGGMRRFWLGIEPASLGEFFLENPHLNAKIMLLYPSELSSVLIIESISGVT